MQVVNPDYAALLPLIAAETDPVLKQQLIDQCYQFLVPLTDAERGLFEYCAFDYMEDNPGYVSGYVNPSPGLYIAPNYVVDGYINNVEADTGLYMIDGYVAAGYVGSESSSGDGFISYVGVYYNDNGDRT